MMVGKAEEYIPIVWNVLSKENANNLLLQLGLSGMGKSTSSRNIIRGAIEENIPIICIDVSDSYRKKDLVHIGNMEYHNIYTEGLNIDIFSPRINLIEGEFASERDSQRADRICELLIHSFNLKGDAQRFELRCAILNHLQDTTTPSFTGIQKELQNIKTPTAKKLCYRLSALSDICTEGLSIDWKDIIQNQKAVIIQLSDFNEPIRTLYTEIILSDLWNWIKKNDNRQELLLVLDEIQNLSFKGYAFMAKLREFRKFGIGTIMSTQFLGKTFDDEAKSLLYQAGVRMYFKPDDINLKSIAMNIDRAKCKEWMSVLKNLDRGECVFCGKTEICGESSYQNIVIKVPFV